jgi:hypothetical protein
LQQAQLLWVIAVEPGAVAARFHEAWEVSSLFLGISI